MLLWHEDAFWQFYLETEKRILQLTLPPNAWLRNLPISSKGKIKKTSGIDILTLISDSNFLSLCIHSRGLDLIQLSIGRSTDEQDDRNISPLSWLNLIGTLSHGSFSGYFYLCSKLFTICHCSMFVISWYSIHLNACSVPSSIKTYWLYHKLIWIHFVLSRHMPLEYGTF